MKVLLEVSNVSFIITTTTTQSCTVQYSLFMENIWLYDKTDTHQQQHNNNVNASRNSFINPDVLAVIQSLSKVKLAVSYERLSYKTSKNKTFYALVFSILLMYLTNNVKYALC